MKTVCGLLGAFSLALSGAHAEVDKYPSRTVTLVVPFPAGGASDIAARHTATKLALDWKVPVVVVNKPGGGSSIGSRFVADAKPDGYTLVFVAAPTLITSQYASEGAPPLSAFAVAGVVAKTIPLLVVNADVKISSLRDLTRAAGNTQQHVTIGVVPGAYHEIMTEQFVEAGKLAVTRVPFRGHAESVVALAGGHIDAYLVPYAPVRSLLEAGKVRALAVAAPRRLAELPDLATFRELGLDFTSESFEALLAPRGTPAPVLEVLEAGLKKALSHDDTVSGMRAAGLIPSHLDRRSSEALLHAQDAEILRAMTRLKMVKHNPRVAN